MKSSSLSDTSPIDYYATAMEYSDALYGAPIDAQIQNALLLLVFAHQHDVGSKSQ